MIGGVGTDIIEVRRIREGIEKYGDRFLNRLFTEKEIQYCSSFKNPALHYAGRFAAKESAFKAMGRGWGGQLGWKEIEIYNEESGAPRLNFYGKALDTILEQKVTRSHVSISHIEEYATAVVVLEK